MGEFALHSLHQPMEIFGSGGMRAEKAKNPVQSAHPANIKGRMNRIMIPLKKQFMYPNDKVEAKRPLDVFHSPIKVKPPAGGEALIMRRR